MTSGGEVSGTLRLVDDVAFLPEGFDIKSRGALSVSCNLALNESGEDDEDDHDIGAQLEPVPKDLKPVQPQPNPDELVARLLAKGLHLDVQQKIQQKQEEQILVNGDEQPKVQIEDDPMNTDTKEVKVKRTALAPSLFIAQRKVLPRSVKKVLDEKQKKESDARVAKMKEERKRQRIRGSVSLAPVTSEEMGLLEDS